jgi:putative ABC transport system permease protein
MRLLRAWLVRFAALFRSGRRERDMAEEFEAHLQLHILDNRRAGMMPEEARRAALVKFGPVEAIKEEWRDRASIPIVELLLQDLRYALRRMRRKPAFTALITLTLALGVGANAAMFGLVDVLMFRTPARVPDPDRIVRVDGAQNYVAYQELRELVRTLEIAAYARQTLSFGQGADAVPLRVECVTPTYFRVAGTAPWRGRDFSADDDQLGAPRTVVLSHGFWRNQFGGDSRAIGTPVSVAGRPFAVIGIAPQGFTGLGLGTIDAWILIAASPEACSFSGTNLLRSTGGSWLTTVGRVRDDVRPEEARAELASVQGQVSARGVRRQADGTVVRGELGLTPMYASRRVSLSPDDRVALWVSGGAAMLFLLACLNVAGLLWTQAFERSREIAVRLQLGASRPRVLAQLLVEHLMVAAVGGAAAVLIAGWIADIIRAYFAPTVDADLMGGRTLAAVAGLAVLAGVLSGLAPALRASRAGAERFLRTGQTVMSPRSRLRPLLLSVQVGLALVLVAAAGLFVGSVENYRRDFAYDLERVIVASIDFRKSSVRTPQEIHGIFRTLEDRVRRVPQVERTALSAAPVLGSGSGALRVYAIRRSNQDPGAQMNVLTDVSPDYFATLGLPIVAGRGFTAADAAAPVVLVSEPLVKQLFPGDDDPIGKRLLVGSGAREIVGVARPFRASVRPDNQAESQIFVPLAEAGNSETAPQTLLVRTRGPASEALPTVAAALQSAATDLPYVQVRTLEQLADVRARSWLLGATVFGLFGALAVALAGIGIYGALSFSIRQRTVEIGVRIALGAVRRDVAVMVLRHGIAVAAAGLSLGLAGAFAGSRYIGSLLFNVAAADAWTFAAACVVVTTAVLCGSIVPAVRATQIDPATALRYD